MITSKYEAYRTFCLENDPREDPKFLETCCNAEGIEYEVCHASDLDISYFESDAEKFKVDNMPSKEEISKHITALYEQMRKDLGSNIK